MVLRWHMLALLATLLHDITANAIPASDPPQPKPDYDIDYWLTVVAFAGPACNPTNYRPESSLYHHPTTDQGKDAEYITGDCQQVHEAVGSVTLLEGKKCTAAFWSGSDCRGWEWRLDSGAPCIELMWASMRLWCWDGPRYGPKGPNG